MTAEQVRALGEAVGVCPACGGGGVVRDQDPEAPHAPVELPCPRCGGSGVDEEGQ